MTTFHLRGGVLPPTPPLPDEFKELREPEEGENVFDDDPPPLVPMEESDISQLNLENLPSGSSNRGEDRRSRPSRQLRNRSVARSVSKDRRVRFQEVIDCVEQDQHYHENIKFDKEGTLFPPLEHRGDLNLFA